MLDLSVNGYGGDMYAMAVAGEITACDSCDRLIFPGEDVRPVGHRPQHAVEQDLWTMSEVLCADCSGVTSDLAALSY